MRYLELNDDVGLHYLTGEPDLISEVGIGVATPTLVEGELVAVVENIVLKHIPGHPRIVRSADPRVVDGLLASGQYHEIDPPTSAQKSKED